MTCHESIGHALTGLRKTGHAAKLPQLRKAIPSAGQKLMDIGLVSHIENQAVGIGIKNGFNGNRTLHNAQITGQMAACLGNTGNEKFPNFLAKLLSVIVIQTKQIFATINLI